LILVRIDFSALDGKYLYSQWRQIVGYYVRFFSVQLSLTGILFRLEIDYRGAVLITC